MFIPAKAMTGPAFSLLAAACIASACASAMRAAAMLGSLRAAARCRSLIIFSSSSVALTELMPKETIEMPRSSRHFEESSSFRASASSVVWAGSWL